MPSPVTRQPGTVRERLAAHLRRVVDAVEEGSEDVAIDAIEDALSVAAPELLRRPFLTRRSVLLPVVSQRIARGTAHSRFAADLLDRMSTDPTSRQASMLLSPLTQRQRNILGYLATSLSAQEIADTLFLSINTLKTHQRAIYQKLDASNRRTAVENARTLGLL